MELLQQHLGKVRVPSAYDNVYKDECVFSFDSPESETGLYICLNTFLGFGKDYVEGYSQKSKNCVFLHIRRLRTEVCHDVNPETGPEKKITRLAIGVEGGFDPEVDKVKYEYQDILNVVVFPEQIPFPFPGENFPQPIVNSVNEIMAAESATKKREREAIAGTWDGEIRQVSKFAADLKQLDNGKKIPPKDWKCEQCDMTQNLWLNLTDGSILCGRKFFDGSGGNDHAINHYNNTKHPLAVKLGTITHDGKGDVYSYEEDDMVEDPNLIQHLSHFGIKITQLEKTEKSMVELELELNQKVGDWSVLCESSSKLEPVFGPGYTGMRNLGNSCYMNSVMQVMFTIPDFVDRYVTKSHEFFDTYPNDPANDFNIQMAKLGVGLCSGKYSKETDNAMDGGVAPIMFKNVIGKNYHDFANKLQQDAHEYFLQLIRIMTVHNYGKHGNPKDAFKFGLEDRVQCNASGKVLYTERDEYHLPLQIPLQKASNIEEVRAYEAKLADAEKRGEKLKPEELVRPKISLLDCIQHFANYEIIDHFYSTAIKGITTAKKTSRFQSFPDYLMLHLKKFTLREDWTSVKLDVSIDCPDVIDLSFLKATAHVDGEELLPKEADDAPQPENFDPIVLEQLVQMGFPLEACKKAMFYTNNVGVGPATDWIMEHITDEDFSEPLRPNKNSKNSSFKPDQNGLEMLMGMGFSAKQATKALSETDNNIERAADWIFSHQSEISEMDTDEDTNQYRDGEGIYQLVAFVSHMGTSTHVGHYVCHILKEGRWVIFNDEKVAISQNPPKDLGYLYLYKRMN